MGEVKQVILCGFGGQGIVLAGTLLGYAAFNEGKLVSGTNSYGAAARGGECASEVVVSDKPITFPHVIEADFLIAMSQAAYNKYISELKDKTGIVIHDKQLVSPQEGSNLRHLAIPATDAATKQLGSNIAANIIMLGAATEIGKIVSREALLSSIKEHMSERFRELNLKAAGIGFDLGQMKQ
ncbi:MAG: 2-oxoacid:acceptor oxidoreductase family protein [Chloroflexota bacterium]|nr:2-oxoacid:acceptor oxidoreductase family protein [Chloroflexota bacterium]